MRRGPAIAAVGPELTFVARTSGAQKRTLSSFRRSQGKTMAYSLKEDLYPRPNFARPGTEMPLDLRRRLPTWPVYPPIVPPPDPNNPFGDPPHFHEVDPPEQNPYNDPDYSPFLVTTRDAPGGLFGMLLRVVKEQNQLQPGADLDTPPKPVRMLARRQVR